MGPQALPRAGRRTDLRPVAVCMFLLSADGIRVGTGRPMPVRGGIKRPVGGKRVRMRHFRRVGLLASGRCGVLSTGRCGRLIVAGRDNGIAVCGRRLGACRKAERAGERHGRGKQHDKNFLLHIPLLRLQGVKKACSQSETRPVCISACWHKTFQIA